MKNNPLFKRMVVKLLLILAFFWSNPSLPAKEDRIYFSRLDVNHGLSSNEVTSIMKDKKGFMWFGTPAGLNRFDGYEFINYKHEIDGTLFSGEYIIHMIETRDENLWITYQNDRISIFNTRINKFFTVEEICNLLDLPLDISHVFRETEGHLLFATSGHRLCKYDYTTGIIIDYPVDKEAGNICDVVQQGNYIYVIHYSGIIEIIDVTKSRIIKQNNYLQSLAQPRRYNLFVDSTGSIWVYFNPENHNGLFQFNPGTDQWYHYTTTSSRSLSSSMIRDVQEGDDGLIWVATDHGGINLIDTSSGSIRYHKNNPFDIRSVSQNSVICLYKDDIGILWAGTYKNGINYYHESIFKFHTLRYPVIEEVDAGINDSNCVYEDKDGNLYIGTNGHGLLYYNRTTGKYRKYMHDPANPNSISSNVIVSIAADKKGCLWLGTYTGGLDCFDGSRFINYQAGDDSSSGLSDNSIYSLYVDEKNNLWIGTLGKGVDRLNLNTGEWANYQIVNSTEIQQANNIYSLSAGGSDMLYVGTTAGLYTLNIHTGRILPFRKNSKEDQPFRGKTIHSVYQDHRDMLWIGTNNGLNVYEPEKDTIYRINGAIGLLDDNVVSIVQDQNYHIWMGSRNGLVRIIPVEDKDGYFSFGIHTYYENEGVQGPQFNRNSLYCTASGELIFGGTEGLTMFDPLEIKYNLHPPKVAVTTLWLQNQAIEPGEIFQGKVILEENISSLKQLTLDYENRNFGLNIAALNHIHPRKGRLAFRMQGMEKEWTILDVALGRTIAYNMSPGSYLFQLKAENNDGVWTETPFELPVIVKSPFWLTGWAILIYVVLFIGFVVLTICIISHIEYKKSEKKQQEILVNRMHEMDQMKLRFFTNVSHEFRTPLTLILNPLERLIKKGNNPEDTVLLKLIQQNADQLLNLVNQLLDFRKIDMQGHVLTLSVGDVIPFIRDIVYSFKELSGKKNIRFTFSSGFNSLPMKFDKDKVYKIIVNLLSNAFKFTPEGGEIKVIVALHSSATLADELVIKIIDNGIGIKKEDREKIFERFYQSIIPGKDNHGQGTGIGLHLCREFVKLHGGNISVESEVGKGSVFTVAIPFITTDVHEIISHVDASTEASINQEELTGSFTESVTDGKRSSLIVIDDNNDFRKFMAISLQDEFSVYEAPDGEQGWELILKEVPDMIICDVMMPGIDGFELCKRLKNDIRTSHIPVILLTAKSGEDSKITGLEAGADDYIGKPFNMDMLQLKIQNLIAFRKKMQTKVMQMSHPGIQLKEVEISSLDEQLIRKSIQYIEDNISSPSLNVERLSQEMGMSRVHYYKKILAITGKAPVELIRSVRLKHAAQLLRKSQKRVGEVALEVGFNDMKLFRKYFKEEFGVLPSDYNQTAGE